MRDLFYGKDIKKAFPKDKGYWVSTANEFKDGTLYSIKETRYTLQYMEVEFEEAKIWEEK